MTNSTRLEQLLAYHKDDPNDAITIYGLALEYLNLDLLKANEYFELLLENHPEYLPTYYHLGHLYEELEEEELATKVYKTGIQLAKKQNNALTLRELQNALNELLF